MGTLEISLGGLAVILLVSAFVKMLTALSILRYGIGLHGSGFGLVIIALALALTLVANRAQFEPLGGFAAVLSGSAVADSKRIEQHFGPFLDKHTAPEVRDALARAIGSRSEPIGSTAVTPAKTDDFGLKSAAFLISELRDAFQVGVLVLIPFVVLDLLAMAACMLLGITQMPAAIIALPLKLLLFVAADGWTMIAAKLIGSYQ